MMRVATTLLIVFDGERACVAVVSLSRMQLKQSRPAAHSAHEHMLCSTDSVGLWAVHAAFVVVFHADTAYVHLAVKTCQC